MIFVYVDQTPCHNSLLGGPQRRVTSDTVLPLRHINPEIGGGFSKDKQPALEGWSICYVVSRQPKELFGHQLNYLLRYLQGYHLRVFLVLLEISTGRVG